MNKIVNKSLLKGDKLVPKLHPKQPVLTYSSCGPFSEHSERIQKLKETGDLQHIYKKELDETCFTHDAAYSHCKDLAKTIVSDKILKDRAYEVAINFKYDRY